jgi:Kef-type K+ transport system membrane component KefB
VFQVPLISLIATSPSPAPAAAGTDPLVATVLALAIILAAAKLFGHLAETMGQPAVLGELVAGIVLGVLGRTDFPALNQAAHSPELALLAGLGVLLLLFEVGLETTVPQMLQVGWPAFRVAVTGVVAPTVLGIGVAAVMIPDAGLYTSVFIGATLCATSVGITARVFKDLGRSQTIEARIILGAAVIDDVLGLIVLAVVAGSISAAAAGASLALPSILLIALKAVTFLGGALWLGSRVAPPLFEGAARLRSGGALLATGLAFCFALSWLAAQFGLAPIVGAFAAGLIIDDVHHREFTKRGEPGLPALVRPIAAFLAPVFFVQMGMLTDVGQLVDDSVLGLGLALTLVGIVGKVIAGYAVSVKDGNVDRLAVGLGMIPRGEVGLIFANVGLGLTLFGQPVIDARSYAALVMMVILTTLVTPPALKWRFGSRTDSGRQA